MEGIVIRAAAIADADEISNLITENAEKLLKPHYSVEQWIVFIQYYSTQVIQMKINTQKVFLR